MKEQDEITNEQLMNLYNAYPILDAINKKNKELVSPHFRFKTIASGEYLKGEECPGLIFIMTGRIKIERIDLEGRQTSLYEIGKGEICHESLSCHMNCETLEIVGYALTTTQIGVLPKDIVDKYLLDDIEFLTYLYKNLYQKLKLIISHKESIIHDSIEERLFKYIEKQNQRIIYATHQEIALELGSSREVISRKLKQLEAEGIVELGRGKIKLIK